MFRKATLSLLLLAFSVTAAQADVGPIRFKTGPLSSARKTPSQVADDLAAAASERALTTTHVIVQFEQPVSDADRAKLQAAGVTLLDYLGDNGYFAAVNPGQYNGARVREVPTLTRSAAIGQPQKLHPELVADHVYDWMIVRTKTPGKESEERTDPTVGVYVKFHSDVTLDPDGVAVAILHGAMIRSKLTPINTLVIELPYSEIKQLVNEDAVEWIEPPLPPLTEVNADNAVRTGANIVQAAPYNLNGSGITALVYDGGKVLTTHQEFGGRAQVGAGDGTSVASHATHVAGTVGAAGVNPAAKGMAPAVAIISYGLQAGGGFLYTDPGDLQADYTAAINTYGADIANNSIGTNTASNGLPCVWEGDYGVTDALIDSIVRGSVSGGQPFRIVWANGNERQVATCNDPNVTAGYHKTAPPACAKNHITVGALNSNNDTMTTFSSWGPADDDRLKPDVTAPGCQVGGDGGVTSSIATANNAYGSGGSWCGTSMASPTVTGNAALLLQDYCAQFPARCPGGNAPDMRNSTLKILLAHTAVDLGNAGPDYQYGYGSVRIQPAIDLMRLGNFLENTVSQDGVYRAFAVVNPGDTLLKITLAWDDPPGTPNVSPALINDLDLVVIDPSNNQRYPWVLGGLANPAGAAIKTQKNSVDNIEQVHVASPPVGLYRIEVRGYSVPQGPQPFSLCASPNLVSCADIGYASLDKSQYNCSSTATLTVIDCDLNTNNGVAETVNVTIASTSEPGGETVTLTETGPATAKFTGTISMSTSNSPGVLQVANGNAVTMTYIDADNGQGGLNISVTANATVDCIQSAISDVRILNVGSRSATVTFVTNENTKGTTRYGTSCGSLTGSASEIPFRTSHTVVMNGLTPLTPYFFVVDSADPGGNITTADNGGACYTFTTLAIPTSLTEEYPEGSGVDQFDLDNKSVLFTPQAGSTGYAACTSSIVSLPTDPAGGTTVTGWAIFPGSTGPLDDGTAYLTVSGGNTVRLHGVAYSAMHVSTNGNIHFTTPDGDYDKTLAKQYAQPRISALFDDLNLTSQGTCTWKQLADRFVVTWENVPEYTTGGTGPGNTFQIEMFFDGRIRLSYLAIPNLDGIVGLSPGGGLSPDYSDTDLSLLSGCGPEFPPYAYGDSVATPINTHKNVGLTAYDYDGDAITQVITSLPLHGKLRDPIAGGTIVSTPYTLAGGGNTVRYMPDAGYLGADYFLFKANDGGVPASGGDSNTAAVSIAVTLPTAMVQSFPLDTNPGWTLPVSQWSFGVPLAGCGDPASGFTGTNVYGNILTAAGCYANGSTPIRYLTTTAINCSGLSGVQLRFKRWLNIEPNDRANIQVSRNGTTYTEVWNYISATLVETSWGTQTYDISAVADGQSTVFIRWGIGPTNATTQMGGWNIDDIEILASVASPCGNTLRGDVNLNATVSGGDIQKFVLVLLNPGGATTQELCAADCNTDGVVDMQDMTELVNLLLNITVP